MNNWTIRGDEATYGDGKHTNQTTPPVPSSAGAE